MKALTSAALGIVGVLIVVTAAGTMRNHLRAVKAHLAHCKEMCHPAPAAT